MRYRSVINFVVPFEHFRVDQKLMLQTLIGGLANIENSTVKEIHDRLNLSAED